MSRMMSIFLMCLCLFGGNSIVSAQEESSEEANPSTLSEVKAQYRQRIRTDLSAREKQAGETLGDLPGSGNLEGKCTSAKQSYRKAERKFSEIEASLTNEYGDEAYKADLQRLKKQTASTLLSARQAALTTGSQMNQRAELETQLASIQKEREGYEAKWRKEDEPPQTYAILARRGYNRASRERGYSGDVAGFYNNPWNGGDLQSLPKLPWEFSVCFPEESEKKDGKVGGNSNLSKPTIKVVYFAAKGTRPDLATVRNRMVQAKKWFQARNIGTLEFRTSVVYAQKNRSFYQTNVWDKVNTELGLTCDSEETSITVIIVDHAPVLRDTDTLGIGQHCGEDYSAGMAGHAMVSYKQLSGEYGLATLVHEMGHALSLPQGDDSVPNAIMNQNIQRNSSTAVLLKQERVALKKSPYFSPN